MFLLCYYWWKQVMFCSFQKVDKLKELVLDKEQEMKDLERYIASCNEAKEQVMRQMDLEEMENEKELESEDDMFTDGNLSFFVGITISFQYLVIFTKRNLSSFVVDQYFFPVSVHIYWR